MNPHSRWIAILVLSTILLTPSLGWSSCITASYNTYTERIRPGESGLVDINLINHCSYPVNLIAKAITLDGDPGNDFETSVYLNPGESKAARIRISVPSYYEDKTLQFYVVIYQMVGNAYAPVIELPKLSVLVFPEFSIFVRTFNSTVTAGGRLLVSIKASKDAVNSIYDAIVFLSTDIEPPTKIQMIKLSLYPNRETNFYVDIPKNMRPGTYKLSFEIWKKKYKLSESDPLNRPLITVLPAPETPTYTTPTQTTTETGQTTTETSPVTQTTEERTTSPTVREETPTIIQTVTTQTVTVIKSTGTSTILLALGVVALALVIAVLLLVVRMSKRSSTT